MARRRGSGGLMNKEALSESDISDKFVRSAMEKASWTSARDGSFLWLIQPLPDNRPPVAGAALRQGLLCL